MIKVSNVEIKQDHFPDGTLHITNMKEVLVKLESQSIWVRWDYENDAELFSLICVTKWLKEHNKNIILNMSYLPHARMDRVKNAFDVFTLKYFCEVINSLEFKEVWVLDPHSNVSLALLNNVHIYNTEHDIKGAISACEADAIFYPDEGASKRYKLDGLPYAFGFKKRDWDSGQILGLDIINEENIKDKTVLIVDDICSRGGTFYHSAKRLVEAGAKEVYLYITHLEETVFEGDLWKEMEEGVSPIKKIYTANPLFDLNKYKETIKDKIVKSEINE